LARRDTQTDAQTDAVNNNIRIAVAQHSWRAANKPYIQ